MNRSLALLTLSTVVVAACSSGDDADAPPAGTAADVAATAVDAPDETLPPVASRIEPGDLAPGSYEFEFLGTSASLTTTEPWFVPVAQDSVVILEDPDQPPDTDARAVLLLRPTGFLSAGDIATGYTDVTGPTDDVDAWIELVGFRVEDRGAADVAGRAADVITGAGPIGDDTFLRTNAPLPFNGTPDGDYIYVRASHRYRIWLIDQGRFDPVVVMAVADPDDEQWFDRSQLIIDALELGEPAAHPNPAPDAAAQACVEGGAGLTGIVQMESYGGLIFSTEQPVDASGFRFGPRLEIYQPGTFAVGFFVLGPLDESPDYTDAESARAYVLGDSVPVEEPVLAGFGTESVGAIVARVEDGASHSTLRNVSLGEGTDIAAIQNVDAFWFFDTEQGIFLVNAFPDADGLAASLAMVESIVPSMELAEGICS